MVCHQVHRDRILGVPGYTLPTSDQIADLALTLGRRTNPAIRLGGVSLNTAHLGSDEAERLLSEESARLNIPVADPIRGGDAFEALVDNCLR